MEDYIHLLSQEHSLSGGTGLIMYIPPNGRVSLSKKKLTNEMGFVSNTKSKIVQKHTKAALIVDKILEMIEKADTGKLDFGLKKITSDHSHILFINETK